MKNISLIILLSFFMTNALNSQDTTSTFKYDVKWHLTGRVLTGTFEQFVFNSNLDFKIETHRWEIHNATFYRYNQTGNTKIEDNWYQLVSLSYFINNKKFFPSGFYHYDNNLMFRVNNRHLFGAGAGTIIQRKKHFIRLDGGFGYDKTIYNGNTFENSNRIGAIRERPLVVGRLVQEHSILNNKLLISNTVFYRHSLEETADYLVILSPKVMLKIIKHLSVNLSYEYRFEKVHLVGLEETNSLLSFGITFHASK
ncbi:MAG TPA: DUF481 domain-containing protein [Saprospiraceae bacterium]|nr:DUF481 domain-containing protein [Saprospiraceae bacterium]